MALAKENVHCKAMAQPTGPCLHLSFVSTLPKAEQQTNLGKPAEVARTDLRLGTFIALAGVAGPNFISTNPLQMVNTHAKLKKIPLVTFVRQ